MRKFLFMLPWVMGIFVLAACNMPAEAQSSSAIVVAVCGTPPATYVAGTNRAITQDVNGKSCVNATVSATVTVAALTSTNLSSTISVTNTFQSIQASTAGRNGCLIQNNSQANEMWVFFGPIGSATKATAFGLPPGTATTPGGSIACAVGGLGVLTDQVSITGTATDTFTANFQ
jgi:hypothetical protein